MTANPIPDLIAWLEAAECGSYKLDCMIGQAIGCPLLVPPLFTAKVDDALKLLPDGSTWTRHRDANGRMTMQVTLPGQIIGAHGQGATPAIELVVAFLRAKQAEAER